MLRLHSSFIQLISPRSEEAVLLLPISHYVSRLKPLSPAERPNWGSSSLDEHVKRSSTVGSSSPTGELDPAPNVLKRKGPVDVPPSKRLKSDGTAAEIEVSRVHGQESMTHGILDCIDATVMLC